MQLKASESSRAHDFFTAFAILSPCFRHVFSRLSPVSCSLAFESFLRLINTVGNRCVLRGLLPGIQLLPGLFLKPRPRWAKPMPPIQRATQPILSIFLHLVHAHEEPDGEASWAVQLVLRAWEDRRRSVSFNSLISGKTNRELQINFGISLVCSLPSTPSCLTLAMS